MARPRGDGIKRTRKRLADGTLVEYKYLRHQSTEPAARPNTLRELIAEYKTTPEYRKKKPGTKRLYIRVFEQIISRMGNQPLHAIGRPDIIRERNRLQDYPSKARATINAYSIVFGYGHSMGYLPGNLARKAGLEVPRRTRIWTVEEECAAMAAFRPALQLAFLLLLYTLQRPSDMLAMTKGHVTERDGRLWIRLRQEKTDELVDVPVHSRLEPLLRARLVDPSGGLLLVPSSIGKQWLYRNFARAWDEDKRKAGITDAQRRDLRRTGVVRLAEAGATTPQIAAISGHRIDYCQGIIDTYLPRRGSVALGGIEVWERAGVPVDKIVRLKRQ